MTIFNFKAPVIPSCLVAILLVLKGSIILVTYGRIHQRQLTLTVG
jgi:hypothetical protein